MIINPDIFESVMLLSFGFAWPASIYKSYKSRSNKGKSFLFLLIILFGYFNGIIYQFLMPAKDRWVLILFFLNAIMVAIDLILFYRNRKLNK